MAKKKTSGTPAHPVLVAPVTDGFWPGHDAFLADRAFYVALTRGIAPKYAHSLAAGVVYFLNYWNKPGTGRTRSLMVFAHDTIHLDGIAAPPYSGQQCTCWIDALAYSNGDTPGSMQTFEVAGGPQCPFHGTTNASTGQYNATDVALRSIRKALSDPSCTDPDYVDSTAKITKQALAMGSSAEFVGAWALWLRAHDPGISAVGAAHVANALQHVPLHALPPFLEPPGAFDSPALRDEMLAYCAQAMTQVHTALANTAGAPPLDYTLDELAGLVLDNAGKKTKKKPKAATASLAAGSILKANGLAIGTLDATGNYVMTTSNSSQPVYWTSPDLTTTTVQVPQNELKVHVGKGRYFRFFATDDGRLDVEFVGGTDEDLTTRAALLLTAVGQMISAKAPKNIEVHGPSLYDWLVDTIGVKLKVHDGVQPGTYYIQSHIENALKTTYVMLAPGQQPVPDYSVMKAPKKPKSSIFAEDETTQAEPPQAMTAKMSHVAAAVEAYKVKVKIMPNHFPTYTTFSQQHPKTYPLPITHAGWALLAEEMAAGTVSPATLAAEVKKRYDTTWDNSLVGSPSLSLTTWGIPDVEEWLNSITPDDIPAPKKETPKTPGEALKTLGVGITLMASTKKAKVVKATAHPSTYEFPVSALAWEYLHKKLNEHPELVDLLADAVKDQWSTVFESAEGDPAMLLPIWSKSTAMLWVNDTLADLAKAKEAKTAPKWDGLPGALKENGVAVTILPDNPHVPFQNTPLSEKPHLYITEDAYTALAEHIAKFDLTVEQVAKQVQKQYKAAWDLATSHNTDYLSISVWFPITVAALVASVALHDKEAADKKATEEPLAEWDVAPWENTLNHDYATMIHLVPSGMKTVTVYEEEYGGGKVKPEYTTLYCTSDAYAVLTKALDLGEVAVSDLAARASWNAMMAKHEGSNKHYPVMTESTTKTWVSFVKAKKQKKAEAKAALDFPLAT